MTRAQLLLGPVGGVDAALTRALDELERERDRDRAWDWRAACQARADILAGRCTTTEAAARLQIAVRTLRGRWARLRLSAPPRIDRRTVQAVRDVIEQHPGAGDAEIARRISSTGAPCTRIAVLRARQAAGIPSQYDRRARAACDEVGEYVRAYPWMTPGQIRDCMLADGWPWRVSIERVAQYARRAVAS